MRGILFRSPPRLIVAATIAMVACIFSLAPLVSAVFSPSEVIAALDAVSDPAPSYCAEISNLTRLDYSPPDVLHAYQVDYESTDAIPGLLTLAAYGKDDRQYGVIDPDKFPIRPVSDSPTACANGSCNGGSPGATVAASGPARRLFHRVAHGGPVRRLLFGRRCGG